MYVIPVIYTYTYTQYTDTLTYTYIHSCLYSGSYWLTKIMGAEKSLQAEEAEELVREV